MRRYVRHHRRRHPREMAEPEVAAFLAHLAGAGLAPSTQNQALAALIFLYGTVLGRPLAGVGQVVPRAREPDRLPAVLTRDEVRAVLAELTGVPLLVARLLYGSGLRLLEALTLRVKDVDPVGGEVRVRRGKGAKDRVTVFPQSLREVWREHWTGLRRLHERDRRDGVLVALPGAFERKSPGAAQDFAWRWVFPATRTYVAGVPPCRCRHHLHETVVQRAVTQAGRRSGVGKRVTCHVFRHSFATHLLEDRYDIRTVQELLGHRDVATTMVYTHVLQRGARGVRSPADRLG